MIACAKHSRFDWPEPDLPDYDASSAYDVVMVSSYAGAGGGGTGDGERMVAKLPRQLIRRIARQGHWISSLIDVRGDSMMPDFHHGDQILIDKRDRNPRQPGPFVLWDEDGYVVKLVERLPMRRGWYRIFRLMIAIRHTSLEETETTILGRPVWFARRL